MHVNKSVICIDFVCKGAEHVSINADLLYLLRQAYPDREIFFVAEKYHLSGVSKAIVDQAHRPTLIEFQHDDIKSRFVELRKLIRFVKSPSVNLVLFTTDNRILFYLFFLRLLYSKRLSKVSCIYHYALNALNGSFSKSLKTRVLIFTLGLFGVRFAVLSGHISHNLLRFRFISRFFDYFFHPYKPKIPLQKIRYDTNRNVDMGSSKSLNVGWVGYFHEDKGAERFLELASRLRDEPQVQMTVVGGVSATLASSLKEVAKFSEYALSYEEYDRQINALDVVVFCFSDDSYAYHMSGAFVDAICRSKPIIYFNNGLFDYYSKLGYEFGSAVNTVDEAVEVITRLSDNPESLRMLKKGALQLSSHFDLEDNSYENPFSCKS